MNINFKILGLDSNLFEDFYSMSKNGLNNKSMWFDVDTNPGYPCRISLEDAELGEKVLAINYLHHNVNSPYSSSGPIFIRQNVRTAKLEVNEVPRMLRHRELSLRGYDKSGIMLGASCINGESIEEGIINLFKDKSIDYIHVHNAKPGCFNCSVVRC